jgi:hypothetical protein
MSTGDDTFPKEALLRKALVIGGYGWHVFPCAPGGKRPALRGSWQDLATTDPAVIRRWWNTLPYNIGIACGPSGLVVLDLDLPGHRQARRDDAAGQASGADALAGLCRRLGQPVPVTFTVRTPSGGRHLYFTAQDAGVRNSAGRLGPLIDVRGSGGYVVAQGSLVGGSPYVVTTPLRPVPFPSWITALLQQPDPPPSPAAYGRTTQIRDGSAYAVAALREEAGRVATAPEGTRNDTLNRAAFSLGQLAAAGLLPPQEITTALTEAATHAGLTAGEADRTIRSGMSAGTRFPRQVPRHPPAPELQVPGRSAQGHAPRR